MIEDIAIRHDLKPGDLGRVVYLHGLIYGHEHGYNHIFEAYVADSLAEFGKQYDPHRDRLWIAERDGDVVGTIGLLARDGNCSQLRWLLVDEQARGMGIGKELLARSIGFAREVGYDSIYLWTVHTLDAATALYVRAGFRLTEELAPASMWGPELIEQRYELELRSRENDATAH